MVRLTSARRRSACCFLVLRPRRFFYLHVSSGDIEWVGRDRYTYARTAIITTRVAETIPS